MLAHLKKELGNEFVVGVEATCASDYYLPQSRNRRWLIGQRADKLTCLGLPGALPPSVIGSPGMSPLHPKVVPGAKQAEKLSGI